MQDLILVDGVSAHIHSRRTLAHLVEISQALQELQHVTLDLWFSEMHVRILEQAGEVMIHVWRDHVHDRLLSRC